jgi:MOSC domain-containing protein
MRRILAELSAPHIVGPKAHLVQNDSADQFDIFPLLIATDGAITPPSIMTGVGLRPNLVIGGVDDRFR